MATVQLGAQLTPGASSPFAAGAGPRAMVSGDFNGDGVLDLATANAADNTITILLGNGAGGFTAATGGPIPTGSPLPGGSIPQSLATGDFNGDGKLDLAVVNFASNTVTVLLGTGTGQFNTAPGSPIPVGASPVFVASADINGDQKADLIVANSGDNTLTVLLGDGTGRFVAAPGGSIALATAPQAIALGDLNKDGSPDIAVVSSSANAVTVLLGDGTGHFHSPASGTFAVGSLPLAVALADMNGDGNLDMLIANAGDNTVSELLGDGTGAFTVAPGSPFSAGSKPSSLAIGDFNGDGVADFITANSNSNNVTLLLGSLAGGFTAATSSPFAAGSNPAAVVIGDFNGDGKPDAAIANLSGNSVTVLLNSLPAITANPAYLSFFAAAGHSSPATPTVSAGGAYTASSTQPWLTVTPASSSTTGPTTVHLSASAASLAAGSYTATARYKAANFFASATNVTLNAVNPSGTLVASASSPFSVGAGPESVALADFNSDGKLDIVTANHTDGTVTVLLGDGVGGFTPATGSPLTAGMGAASLAVGDFNGDGKPDIVVANSVSNNVSLFLGNGSGGFRAAATFAVGSEPLSLAVADVNGDGKLVLSCIS